MIMRDIIIERIYEDLADIKSRYTRVYRNWFPEKKKENKLSKNHDVWYKIMVSNYDN